MASSQYAQPSQTSGQSPFFYYNPESSNDHRQHGMFSTLPKPTSDPSHMQLFHQQQMYQPEMMMQEQPQMFYPSPTSYAPQGFLPSKPAADRHTSVATMASPRPMQHKAAFLYQHDGLPLTLDTECGTPDVHIYPSTPPLSVSGSSISTPPSTCGLLPTPVTGPCYTLENLEGVKEGCEGDVQSEILAGGEWTRCCSPPLTPVFVHPPSVTASQASDLLSVESCPSLSPSPSPVANTNASTTDIDFCDPRNLLVGPSNNTFTTAAGDLPALPALPILDSGAEGHIFIHGEQSAYIKPEHQFVPSIGTAAATLGGLPAFDSFSDLDSEHDHTIDPNHFSPCDSTVFLGSKRQRLELPFEEDEFLSEDSLGDLEDPEQFTSFGLMTPPDSRRTSEDASTNMKPKKRSPPKKARKATLSDDALALATTGNSCLVAAAEPTGQQTNGSQQTGENASETKEDDIADDVETSAAGQQPAARRGRKQSLTDDPSKTFVCTLCSRRFRRQEHLKRHYRSLHTHDKPFECNECGKRFSRSDNLSQHARTHGSGAIVMGVLEDGELPPAEKAPTSDGEASALGSVLFEAAAAAAANGSSASSTGTASPAPSPKQKKRKRED